MFSWHGGAPVWFNNWSFWVFSCLGVRAGLPVAVLFSGIPCVTVTAGDNVFDGFMRPAGVTVMAEGVFWSRGEGDDVRRR